MWYLVIKAAISGIIVAALSVSRPLFMFIPLFLERDVPFYTAPTLIGARYGSKP